MFEYLDHSRWNFLERIRRSRLVKGVFHWRQALRVQRLRASPARSPFASYLGLEMGVSLPVPATMGLPLPPACC